jgi:hypothetical protein
VKNANANYPLPSTHVQTELPVPREPQQHSFPQGGVDSPRQAQRRRSQVLTLDVIFSADFGRTRAGKDVLAIIAVDFLQPQLNIILGNQIRAMNRGLWGMLA